MQTSNIIISVAQDTDVSDISTLMQNTFGSYPKTEEMFTKWIREPIYHVTTAKTENKIVGIAASYINSEPNLSKYELFGDRAIQFLKGQKLGWFLTLAILPTHRKSGIGWQMAKAHAEWLKDQGCTCLVGTSWINGSEDNSAHMFIKAGFEKLGESNQFLRSQLQGTGSICSACKKTDCECLSVMFGRRIR